MFKALSRIHDLRSHGRAGQASFPYKQLFVLALCRICEPIAFMSIFPYIYYMISSFNITQDDRKIAVYAGMVTSSFAFAEFSTGVMWGRLSDRIGRKPVLILGLAGTGLSMIVFGFAPSLPAALVARALGGLLNGNIGVLQTTVAEIITVKEHQPRAYSIMPFVWCLGSILGPAMGGALAQPCKNYPRLFPRDTIFDKYPFLLPNLVCTVIIVFGVLIGILFLEETHAEKRYRRDVGLELGNWIVKKCRGEETQFSNDRKIGDLYCQADHSLFEDEQPPGYRTTEGSPRISVTTGPAALVEDQGEIDGNAIGAKSRGLAKAFNKQVIINIIGYGILAYHSVSFDQLMPVFMSTPISDAEPSLPFKFTGGFSLSTKAIGFMMACQGGYAMVAQLFFFPFIVRRFGILTTFRSVTLLWPLLYFAVPYLILLPTNLQVPGIYFCLIVKITFHVIAFPSNAILLTNSAPSLLVLGAINGVAASTASLSRAFGPTITGLIHSAGLEMGCSGLAWWASGLVCAIGAVESFWMEEVEGRMDRAHEDDEEATVCEPFLNSQGVETANVTEDVALLATRRGSLESVEALDLSFRKA